VEAVSIWLSLVYTELTDARVVVLEEDTEDVTIGWLTTLLDS
jgi:hypothetical protein